jgi:hypothetical protein
LGSARRRRGTSVGLGAGFDDDIGHGFASCAGGAGGGGSPGVA